MQFNEIILFDFDLPYMLKSYNEIKFDNKLLEIMKQPLILEVIHQRGNRTQVMGTKVLDWKSLIYEHPFQTDAVITALELDQKKKSDKLGELKIELDVVP